MLEDRDKKLEEKQKEFEDRLEKDKSEYEKELADFEANLDVSKEKIDELETLAMETGSAAANIEEEYVDLMDALATDNPNKEEEDESKPETVDDSREEEDLDERISVDMDSAPELLEGETEENAGTSEESVDVEPENTLLDEEEEEPEEEVVEEEPEEEPEEEYDYVSSDFDGNFSIEVSEGAVLVISFVGYQTQEITVGSEDNISVALEAGNELEEVVVTSLGITREKQALGYAISEVDDTALEQRADGDMEVF